MQNYLDCYEILIMKPVFIFVNSLVLSKTLLIIVKNWKQSNYNRRIFKQIMTYSCDHNIDVKSP